MSAPPDTSGTLRDVYGLIICLAEQDRRGLEWVKTRCQQWRNHLKRRRRYGMPRGCGYTEQEGEVIDLLMGLEDAAGRLLRMTRNENSAGRYT